MLLFYLIMQKKKRQHLKRQALENLGQVLSHSQRRKQLNLPRLDLKKVPLSLKKYWSSLQQKRTGLVKSKTNKQKWRLSQNMPIVVLTAQKASKNLVT